MCRLSCIRSFNNQGGLVQQLLAHKGWVPLSRLTFGAYLLHPLVSTITAPHIITPLTPTIVIQHLYLTSALQAELVIAQTPPQCDMPTM
jgi:peptidoglycan/LPS O-acetylase OafA/YrhL